MAGVVESETASLRCESCDNFAAKACVASGAFWEVCVGQKSVAVGLLQAGEAVAGVEVPVQFRVQRVGFDGFLPHVEAEPTPATPTNFEESIGKEPFMLGCYRVVS